MRVRTRTDVERLKGGVDQWRRVSDDLVKIGPIKLGLDGILTWIPGVGGAYGLAAGGYLLTQAVRARASRGTLVKMGMLIGADALVGEVPVIGDAFDFLFRAHARCARMLQSEIEGTHYVAIEHAHLPDEEHVREARAQGKKRVVRL